MKGRRYFNNRTFLLAPSLLLVLILFLCSISTVSAVSINKKNLVLKKGKTVQLKILDSKAKAYWMSNKSNVVFVNKKGTIKAKKEGTAKISAIVEGKRFTCKVTVEDPRINKKSLTLSIGNFYNLKLLGTKRKVKWSSNKSSIATVNTKGTVKAKKVGKAKITAKLDKKKYSCNVKVTKAGEDQKTPVNPPMVPTFPANGLTGRLVQENKGTLTTSIYLDVKNNTASTIQIESGAYIKNTADSDNARLNLNATDLAPGADAHIRLAANYADSNSQLIISFYYNGYNYSAIINTVGNVTVQSPTVSAAEVHNLMAAYYLTLLKEIFTSPDSIVINRIKAGTKVIDGREVSVCEFDITAKNNAGNSVRGYYLVRQYGKPSNLSAIQHPSIGYLWYMGMNTTEDKDIQVSKMLDPNTVVNQANALFAGRNYQLFNN